ncbi:MAG: hypothetical protein AAGA97_03105 [Pseudomonadota bacterium]
MERCQEEASASLQFDHYWRELTQLANDAFASQAYIKAAQLYNETLVEADRIYAHARSTGEEFRHAPPMVVVTVCNVARNCDAMGSHGAGDEVVDSALMLFTEVLKDEAADLDLRRSTALHLSRLSAEVLERKQANGKHKTSTLELIRSAREAAERLLAPSGRMYLQ